jgi:hypothetical protein
MPTTNETTGVTTGSCTCQASRRCVWCTYGTHYRMEGKCEKCPENPALVIAGIVVALIVCCVGSYILDKRDFNLAFISIGVDYFQVLALFASADVRWPSALKTLFRMLSFFNLNLGKYCAKVGCGNACSFPVSELTAWLTVFALFCFSFFLFFRYRGTRVFVARI